jgi:nicotinamide riboside transporter PnuC
MIDIIGWIGNLFFILGAIFLAKKMRIGWHCQVLGNLCYVIVGLFLNTSSLWALSILLIGINIYGLYQWKGKKNE